MPGEGQQPNSDRHCRRAKVCTARALALFTEECLEGARGPEGGDGGHDGLVARDLDAGLQFGGQPRDT